MVFGIIIGLIIMGAVGFMAVDKNSTFPMRLASLGALALMILTLIICIVVVLTDNRVPVDESVLIVGEPVEVKAEDEGSNMIAIIISILFLLVLFFVIAFLAMREHKRGKEKK